MRKAWNFTCQAGLPGYFLQPSLAASWRILIFARERLQGIDDESPVAMTAVVVWNMEGILHPLRPSTGHFYSTILKTYWWSGLLL